MGFVITEFELPTPSTNDLIGQWHIVRTTFPMWRSGKNQRPSLNYTRIAGADHSQVEDLVIYEKRKKPRTIRGVDTQDPELPCHFRWRGRGLLKLLSSDWYIVDLADADGDRIMAIYFTKTLFTPAGLDIVATSPTPARADIDACVARISVAALLRPHVEALVELAR